MYLNHDEILELCRSGAIDKGNEMAELKDAAEQERLKGIMMFGTYARNVLQGQSRYWPDKRRAEMLEDAMKSEKAAEPLYADLAASRAFCDEMNVLRKEHPNSTWRELLTKFKPFLSNKHPYHFQEAMKMIDDPMPNAALRGGA